MTMMTRLLTLLAMALLASVSANLRPTPALAASFGPVVTVNGMGITNYEIDQRQRFMELLNTPGTTREDAEKALIQDRLRIWAARRIGLTVGEEGVKSGMAEFARRANLSTEEFVAALAKGGVTEATFRDFATAGIVWRELIRARFGSQVSISSADLDRAMMPESQVGQGIRVLISEAIIPAPAGRENEAMALAKQLSEARGEDAFGALARQYSASQSAAQGGRLSWMPATNLPPRLRPVILALKPGTATAPIPLQDAVAVFMLRAIGDGKGGETRPQSLTYMTLDLGASGSRQATDLAARAAANGQSCDMLYTVARGLPASAIDKHDAVPQAQIPTDIGLTLARMDLREQRVLHRGGTDMLVMLCNRQDIPAGDEQTPRRKQVRARLENQALTSYADGYMADLEADAVILRP